MIVMMCSRETDPSPPRFLASLLPLLLHFADVVDTQTAQRADGFSFRFQSSIEKRSTGRVRICGGVVAVFFGFVSLAEDFQSGFAIQ